MTEKTSLSYQIVFLRYMQLSFIIVTNFRYVFLVENVNKTAENFQIRLLQIVDRFYVN